DEKNGFYFLKNRTEVIRTRIDRQKIADQKWKKAKKIIRRLQIVPYVRMVAVSGSLALNNTQEESDIDVLIVVRAGRIWLARFFVTTFLQLIGKRRHKNFTKDRICLNHYITDKSLDIKFRSLYNAQTYAHMIPVLEIEKNIYEKFQKVNRWVKDYLVFWSELEAKHFKALKTNYLLKDIAKIGEICLNNSLGDLLEKLLKAVQKKSIEKDPLTHKKGGRVTIDDTQLEFHPDSPERKILDKYNRNMLYLGVKKLGHEKDSGLL
ncbi:MAG: nucleotidyltransferase domain-containing protein, partial [Candidatus Omnitrophica bacterium]|nr:nucleotidyltransferase domain-containing protein [Candidatus Omnitrophota bacterium]